MRLKMVAVAAALAALAGCATPAPPPPPPPPPPPVVRAEPVPYRPIPPAGSPYVMTVPERNSAGERLTVNHGIDEHEAVWHFRSGWNVAALNCLGPNNEIINTSYSAFLRAFPNGLRASNDTMERRFRDLTGSSRAAIRAREEHSTQVYNYFALPGARANFCAAARQIATDFGNWEGDNVREYAAVHLPLLESAFLRFFDEYESYQQLSADWDRQYGQRYGASQPGYVAVWGAQGMPTSGVSSSLIAGEAQPAVGAVIDPDTGASIPVVPVSDAVVSTPVVQLLPAESAGSE